MMIKKDYKDFDTFIQDIIDVYLENEGFSVLCDYELACKIIKKFLSFDDNTRVNFISLDPPEWGEYGDEFVVSNFKNELFCERARRDGKPIIISDESVVFVQRDFVKDDFRQNGYIPKIHFEFSIDSK
nr:MAG TPA: hypothetical protein [Caudoviricetes sp.]